MALLASLEKAIKLCKEEQARLQSCIQRHRELLIALAPQPKTAPDESQPFRPAETDPSPGEAEDLKLLEQALEKALRVRTGGALSKNSRDRNKHFGSGRELVAGVVTLWDKVAAAQRKAVPGRSRFMERMSAMVSFLSNSIGSCVSRLVLTLTLSSCFLQFPEDRPCGSPDQIRALVGSMTHQGNENQTETLLDRHSPRGATEPEWEAWDRWRPEGGCLYPAAASLDERDGVSAPLPLTICYRTKAELTELERLRMNVALLQQEVFLQQALLDALSAQLAAIVSGCSDPSVLRDLYSLLGEGGRRFPAIVLDCD
ncbi:uncharacterized protein tedc2 [Neosynchiropus ocellatus]